MQKLLVICGPTGTGKTGLAIELAEEFDGEIVSADSRQVYKEMDIGTGKELESQKTEIQKENGFWTVNGVRIHLYDLIKPDKRFSLAEYQQIALQKIQEVHDNGKLPILVGGTGLYIQAITEGLKIPKAPPNLKLRSNLETRSLESLLSDLKDVDPDYYEKVDKNNKRRVIRALEVFHQLGEPFSSLQKKYKVPFEVLKIGLTSDREDLYQRNDERVENWFEVGFVEEVKRLLEKYPLNLSSLTSLGYRQVAMYINKEIELAEAKQRTKFEVHGYIRRQLTWFKRDKTIFWYDYQMENFNQEIKAVVENWLENQDQVVDVI